ncbi:DUF2207 domain-containing protein [Clostridium sp. CM027]|uniref:DUF2207 domain-containing protein n=1 Tax=Clostridium sp. CM027 TaxID=2849865 RepID=UPI001C6E14AD|nr:DUF2207 domain-containing protein [Clostridium sp. CM027]MBW9146656.1 DUF2207 domain-containing protein [Clostridium sp. CM027]UVE42023.1 DUF2207 domain-containing protein [Clostridium sp. CM027]
MKKGFTIIFTKMFLAIVLFTLSTFGQQVYASGTKTYNLSRYAINVIVNKDGSANFEERLTYNFDGKFNGVTRDVDFSFTKGIKDKKVYVLENDNLKELQLNPGNSLDATGKPGTYNFIEEGTLARLKLFEVSKNQEKTFVIKYKLIDAVTKYKDTAEFNRKIIDSRWKTRLDNIKIKITLPPGATKEELKIFTHGPLIGESSILDNRTVEFTVPTVSPGTFIETLVLFPINLVPGSSNVVDETALPRIMANEATLADEANKTREESRKEVQQQVEMQSQRKSVGNPLAIVLILLWFPIIYYIYIKYDKEIKPNFYGKYYRELPGDYTPAEMSVLMSFGKVNTRDVMATLMDLARKKKLIISQNKITKKGFFNSKEIDKYVITLNEKAPSITLKTHEEFLISWFIGKIGNGNYVALDEIKDYVKEKSEALEFKADYDKWNTLACEEAAKNDFFDQTCKKGILLGTLTGFSYLLIGIAVTLLLFTPIAVVAIIQGVIMVIFSTLIKRRTAYGNEQHAMWQSFKNFLKDFSRLDKAEIPSIILWEHYLVYAISLGVAKEVIKQLPIVFSDEDLNNNNNLTYMYGASYGYFSGFGAMFDDTIHTVEGAISTAQSVASSENSSSSGGGGGFSGGSSGGGGGCGGGGAF